MQLLVAAALVLIVGAAAVVLQRRRRIDPPTQADWEVPAQIDRADFPNPEAEWLVATFTSATCMTCADVARKAAVLASAEVAVFEAEFTTHRALHQRYRIDAVPTLIIADSEGVVRSSFLGPVTATDLWAAYATLRDPGSAPTDPCHHHE